MATQTITPQLSRRIAGGRYRDTLIEHLREVEEQGARVNSGPAQKHHVALLYALREAINGLAVDSLAFGRLILIQRYTTGGEDYKPGRAQRRFLSSLGSSRATPSGEALLDEFQLAATEDLIATLTDRVRIARDTVAAETRQAVRTKYESEVARAQASEDRARSKVAELEARNAELTGDNEFLRGRLDNGNGSDPEPPKAKRMRRKHHDEDPAGVYRTEQKDDTIVYEVKVKGHPWETVGTDREKAIERVRELTGEKAEPEAPKDSKPRGPTGNLRPEEIGIS